MRYLIKFLFLALTITVFISACGGGGDGDGDPTNVNDGGDTPGGGTGDGDTGGDQTTGLINSRNFQDVASQALSPTSIVITGSQVSESQVSARSLGSSAPGPEALGSTLARIADFADTRAITPIPTQNCAFGGTQSGEIDTGTDNLLSAGDTASVAYSNCALNAGEVWNGEFKFTFNQVGSTITDFTITFDNVTLSKSGATVLYSGDMTLAASQSGTVTTSSIKSNSLTIVLNGETANFTGLDFEVSFDSSTQVRKVSNNFSMTIESVGAPVTVNTDQPFEYMLATSRFPTVGRMRITAPDGSFMELDADSGDVNTAMITFSSDGVTTESRIVNWQDLQ